MKHQRTIRDIAMKPGTWKTPTVLAILAAVCFGCEKNNRIPVHPVRGEVRVNGSPAANAQVFFHPVGGLDDLRSTRPFATTNADGVFELSTYMTGDGAPEGDYVVTITIPPKGAGADQPGSDVLKFKFAYSKSSILRATVKPGKNELAPFDLK